MTMQSSSHSQTSSTSSSSLSSSSSTMRFQQGISLNNQGVRSLQSGDFKQGIERLGMSIQLFRQELADLNNPAINTWNNSFFMQPRLERSSSYPGNVLQTDIIQLVPLIGSTMPSLAPLSHDMVSHALLLQDLNCTSAIISDYLDDDYFDEDIDDEEVYYEVILRLYSSSVIFNLALAHHLYYLQQPSLLPVLKRAQTLYPMALQVLSGIPKNFNSIITAFTSSRTYSMSDLQTGWSIVQLACSINVMQLTERANQSTSSATVSPAFIPNFHSYYKITCEALNRLTSSSTNMSCSSFLPTTIPDVQYRHQIQQSQARRRTSGTPTTRVGSSSVLSNLVHLAHGMVLCQRPTSLAPAA